MLVVGAVTIIEDALTVAVDVPTDRSMFLVEYVLAVGSTLSFL